MAHDTDPEQTIRAQLNEIADHWTTHGEYPEGIAVTDVQKLGQTLHDQLADHIETYVTETNFTRREAEVWALHRNVDEHHHFVTHEAAALLFCTPGTGFGCTTDVNEKYPERQTLTSEDVELRFRAAKQTVDDAKQTLGAATFPDRDDVLTSPELVWLDGETIQRFQQQYQPGENTLDDVATRVLDETETRYSLEAFVRGYLNARGTDNVVQVAVARESFERETIRIATHTPAQDELPDIVTETDAITYHGHRYDLHFHEDPSRPTYQGHITLYASDTIDGMDEVALADGLAAADEHMQQLLDSDEPLPTRIIE